MDIRVLESWFVKYFERRPSPPWTRLAHLKAREEKLVSWRVQEISIINHGNSRALTEVEEKHVLGLQIWTERYRKDGVRICGTNLAYMKPQNDDKELINSHQVCSLQGNYIPCGT
jgi:hypothetical protein